LWVFVCVNIFGGFGSPPTRGNTKGVCGGGGGGGQGRYWEYWANGSSGVVGVRDKLDYVEETECVGITSRVGAGRSPTLSGQPVC